MIHGRILLAYSYTKYNVDDATMLMMVVTIIEIADAEDEVGAEDCTSFFPPPADQSLSSAMI